MQPFRQIKLENGLILCFYDHTHRYFGDYHRIRVDITCQVPLLEEYFRNRHEWESAVRVIGRTAEFGRSVEQMGVPSAEVEASLEEAVENFLRHALPYLSSPDFPGKVIKSQLTRRHSTVPRRYQG